MNESIKHRWPDDGGVFFGKIDTYQVALGQRRLSIIDLSEAWHQPMYYEKTKWASNDHFHPGEKYDSVIVFNGEIYNHLDIQNELVEKGYVFSTHSDTEVILASYDAWWIDCVERFNWMWAFVLFDTKKNHFFCSRDRFWKKPFYFYCTETDFIFSSEIKWILEHKDLTLNRKENISEEAIDFYFTTGNIPAPFTIYKNIKKLEAGHNILLRPWDDGLAFGESRFYDIPDFSPVDDRQKLIDEGRVLLEDAVKIRMFSADVPVWAFLSWGLDSSSVVAEMMKFTDRAKLHTFSIGFDGRYDETPYINIVKDAFGTNHHHKYFREEDFREILKNISYYYDEPFADYSSFPMLFVSQLARQYVTVSLSGDGWDEIFGGYMMHQVAAQMKIIYSLPLWIRNFFATIIPKTNNNLSILSKMKEAFRVSTFPKEDFYAELGWSTLYRPSSYKVWTREKLKVLLGKNHWDFTQTIIDFDLLYNTIPDNFLVKVDRASMSQGLEVRSPFLDYRFVEYSRRLPVKWKVNSTSRKILMKEIITGIVPDAIVKRPKQWFEPPITDWILEDEYMQNMQDGLEVLFQDGIISKEWYIFYKDQVFANKNQVFNVFKIKLFLLLDWREKWIH